MTEEECAVIRVRSRLDKIGVPVDRRLVPEHFHIGLGRLKRRGLLHLLPGTIFIVSAEGSFECEVYRIDPAAIEEAGPAGARLS